MLMGEEPVGRPRTKGCSGVGAKALMRSIQAPISICKTGGRHSLTNNVLRNISRSFCLAVSDDESHIGGS